MTQFRTQPQHAHLLRALHERGLILPCAWDAVSAELAEHGPHTDSAFFTRMHALPWGEMPGWVAAIYAVDNGLHHRAQGYVYLRALGIEPPAFYDR